MTKIPEGFKNIHTLDGLKKYLDETNAKDIGFFGGRKFVHGDNGELTLNHIVRKFGFIVANLGLKVDNPFTEFEEQMLEIQNRIGVLDKKASKKVKKKNLFTRTMTQILHSEQVIRPHFLSSSRLWVSRKDVLNSILNFKTKLTNIHKDKADYVGTLFDKIFSDPTQKAQEARVALINLVKLNNDENDAKLKVTVKELFKDAPNSKKLEKLIYKFLTKDDTLFPLAQFIFKVYAEDKKLGDGSIDESQFNYALLKNHPKFNKLKTVDNFKPKFHFCTIADIPTELRYLDGSINLKYSERHW